MHRVLIFGSALLLFFAVAGCGEINGPVVEGSGVLVTRVRVLEPISEVSYHGPGSLIVRQASTTTLTLTGDDNILPSISTEVANNRLTVHTSYHFAPHGFTTKHPVTVSLTVPHLKYIRGSVQINGLTGDEVAIEALETDEIVIENIALKRLKVIMTESATVRVTGVVQHLEVTNWGSGNFDGRQLQSNTASIHIDSSGNATTRVVNSLEALVTGRGSLFYIGDPSIKQKDIGPGSIQQITDE